MHFKNLITLTASFFLCGSVSGDLCSKSMELRKIRKNQTINWSERQNDYNKYDTDVLAELCEDGYTARICTEYEIVCEPVCLAGCENGTCTAPGTCDCAVGFELRSNLEKAECVPVILNNGVRLTKGLALTKEETEDNKDLSICKETCYCWKEDPAEMCTRLCETENNRCLEPKFSFCNESDGSIIYKKDANPKIYFCSVPKTYTTNYKADYATRTRWIIIGGCIFIGIMLIAIFYLCVRIYQTRHETGAHDIPISLLMKF